MYNILEAALASQYYESRDITHFGAHHHLLLDAAVKYYVVWNHQSTLSIAASNRCCCFEPNLYTYHKYIIYTHTLYRPALATQYFAPQIPTARPVPSQD